MEFNFPKKIGTGIKNLIPHASPECVDLIDQLLKYNPEERISSSDALKHIYFREFWDNDYQKELSTSIQYKFYISSVGKYSNVSFVGNKRQGIEKPSKAMKYFLYLELYTLIIMKNLV